MLYYLASFDYHNSPKTLCTTIHYCILILFKVLLLYKRQTKSVPSLSLSSTQINTINDVHKILYFYTVSFPVRREDEIFARFD